MVSWLTISQLVIDGGAALILAVLSLLRRKPSGFSLALTALVLIGLLVQAVVTIILVSHGQQAKGDTIEFFGYVFVAMILPVAAGFWAFVERTRWSTAVLALQAATVLVMLARMQQIWVG